MTITKHEDGTTTITMSNLEVDLIAVATEILSKDEDTSKTNAKALQEIANQL
jgi:hypothetical protein